MVLAAWAMRRWPGVRRWPLLAADGGLRTTCGLCADLKAATGSGRRIKRCTPRARCIRPNTTLVEQLGGVMALVAGMLRGRPSRLGALCRG